MNTPHTLPSYLDPNHLGPWGIYLQQVDRVTPYLGHLARWSSKSPRTTRRKFRRGWSLKAPTARQRPKPMTFWQSAAFWSSPM